MASWRRLILLYLAGVTGYSPAATVRLVHRRDAAPQALWFFSLAPALTILPDPLRAFAPNAPVHPLAGTPAVALLPSSSAAKDRVPCPLPVDPGLPALPKPLLPEPSRYALQSPAACPATSAPVAFSSLSFGRLVGSLRRACSVSQRRCRSVSRAAAVLTRSASSASTSAAWRLASTSSSSSANSSRDFQHNGGVQ